MGAEISCYRLLLVGQDSDPNTCMDTDAVFDDVLCPRKKHCP